MAGSIAEGEGRAVGSPRSMDPDSQMQLFAHLAAATVNVLREPWDRRPGAIAHGNVVARDVGLDMAAAGWTPTVDNYLGRVPKARILEAVREAAARRKRNSSTT